MVWGLTQPDPSRKTAHQFAAEAAKPLAEIGDLTSAFIRYQQKMAELNATHSDYRSTPGPGGDWLALRHDRRPPYPVLQLTDVPQPVVKS